MDMSKIQLDEGLQEDAPTFDRITLKRFIECGVGGTIISILVDKTGFGRYENSAAFPGG